MKCSCKDKIPPWLRDLRANLKFTDTWKPSLRYDISQSCDAAHQASGAHQRRLLALFIAFGAAAVWKQDFKGCTGSASTEMGEKIKHVKDGDWTSLLWSEAAATGDFHGTFSTTTTSESSVNSTLRLTLHLRVYRVRSGSHLRRQTHAERMWIPKMERIKSLWPFFFLFSVSLLLESWNSYQRKHNWLFIYSVCWISTELLTTTHPFEWT